MLCDHYASSTNSRLFVLIREIYNRYYERMVFTMKIDATKIIALAGTGLTIAATIVGKISEDKQLKETVAKEVAKQLAKK